MKLSQTNDYEGVVTEQSASATADDEWRYVEVGHGAHVAVRKFRLSAHWNGLADSQEIRAIMQQIVNDHNQHQQCASQLQFLGNRLEAQAKQMAELAGENERLREALELTAKRIDFLTNWIENSYGGVNRDVELGRKDAAATRAVLNHAARGETVRPRRRIYQNAWGNWNGYEGSHKVREFGTGEFEAREWLQDIEREPVGPISLRRFEFEGTEPE